MLPLVALVVLTQAPDAGAPQDPVEGPLVHLFAGAEAEAIGLPSGWNENGLDVFFGVRPMVGLSVGEVFSLRLGPLFRLRVIDLAPLDRPRDLGGVLRGEDWDRPGDFGELLQALRIGTETSAFRLEAGPVQKYTLGLGHVVFRYSNRANADARPASATALLSVGPVKAEVFAADVLSARLFAGEVTWDLGRTFSPSADVQGRYVLAVSAAYDAAVGTGSASRPTCADGASCVFTPPVATVVHLDGSVALLRGKAFTLLALAGLGARGETRDLGFLAGLAMDTRVAEVELSLRAEGRKQAGGFRQGFFSGQYELQRFAGLGFSGTPLALEVLPDAFSVFGELRLRLFGAVTLDGALEHFTVGRTDLDATLAVELLGQWLVAEARLGAVGLGQTPRWLVTGGLRWRLFKSFYVLAAGGTVFFPQGDGSLRRGVTASAGVGVDLER